MALLSQHHLSPADLKQRLPLVSQSYRSCVRAVNSVIAKSRAASVVVQKGRNAVRSVLAQHDSGPISSSRLLVMIGPCSVHDPAATLEYATRLKLAAEKHPELLIVMRVYVEKPRTTVGWKGLLHDPDLTQKAHSSMAKGLYASRDLMLRVLELGLPIVTEVLTPFALPFFEDLLSVGVIGARTTESQTHRELVSDSPIAFGFKNGTDGSPNSALDAMKAAANQHTLLGVDENGLLEQRISVGNEQTFLILRGGKSGPNFSAEHVKTVETTLRKAGQPVRIVVDCSHGNSNKDYRKQTSVARSVAAQFAEGASISGLMLESNINAGRQDIPDNNEAPSSLRYGVSVTDGCIDWQDTDKVLDVLANAVQIRRHSQNPGPVLVARQQRCPSFSQAEKPKLIHTVHVAEIGILD